MVEHLRTFKSSTLSVFKDSIQKAILVLNQRAILDGFDVQAANLNYVISEVDNNWVVLLLVFVKGTDEPKEYIETVSSDE
jgi:hypothetical protein